TVTVGGQGTPAPSANFTFSPQNPFEGQQVVFDWRTTTTAQGQRIVSLDWNFGDSTPIVHCPGDPACTADGITVHTFMLAGVYNVNLVVTDSAGRTAVKSTSVTVATGAPTARLTLIKRGSLDIQADASASTGTGTSKIVTYVFIWGDNTPDTVTQDPVAAHGYAPPVFPLTSETFTV